MQASQATCPQCGAQYRLKAVPAAGARLKCPKCETVFSANAPIATATPSKVLVAAPTAAAATPKRNWLLVGSLAAAGVLMIACTVLVTLLLSKGGDPAEPVQVAQAAALPTAAENPAPTSDVPTVATPAAAAPPPVAVAAEPQAPPEADSAPTSPKLALAETDDASSEIVDEQPAVVAPVADPAPAEADPPAVAEKPAAKKNPLAGPPRYQWQKGDIHAYKFEIVADLGDEFDKVTGACQLEISPWKEEKPAVVAVDLPGEVEEPLYTGSAFVVHPDGYLATCSHVVEGAKTVKLQLNEQEYEAEVIATDEENDLALLKVKARKLKSLPLADSDKAPLGEDIRVLGYPLSDLLGGNLKVSQGIVAGIVMDGQSKRLQIDATVNPGNSGGPVVNSRGEVVGMAASMLSGTEVSKLGFAVPANCIRDLLAAQKIKLPAAAGGDQPVDGPALISRVSASMALVQVTGGGEPSAAGQTIAYNMNYHSARSRKNPNEIGGFRGPGIGGAEFPSGKLRVDEHGRLLEAEGEPTLPYTVGCMPALMIEPLSRGGQNFWKEEAEGTVTRRTDPFFRMGAGGFQPPRGIGFNSPFAAAAEETFPAKYRHSYRILKREGDLVFIEKSYVLKTQDDETSPYLSIEGKGKLTFDQRRGCVMALDYKQTSQRNIDNVSVSIPMRISFSRQSAKEFVEERLARATAQARRGPRLGRAREGDAGRTAEQQVDDLIRSIERQMDGEGRSMSEVSELGDLDVVPSRQAKVAKLLLEVAAADQRFGASTALRALEKWADASCVPALIKLVGSNDHFTSTQAAEILGKLGDPKAAQPIAEALANAEHGGHQYGEALKALGPEAEAAVLPLLKHADEDVRRSACEVLGEIGTSRSVKALQAIAGDSDEGRFGAGFSFESHQAERALEEIQRRGAGRAALAEIPGGAASVKKRTIARGTSLDRAKEVLADRGASEDEVRQALQQLENIAPPNEATRKELSVLIARTLSQDDFTRSTALRALAKWGGPENEDQLLALLRDDEVSERTAIYEALARAGGDRSAKLLITGLQEHKHNRGLAPAIAAALGASSKPGPVQEAIFALLKDPDIVMRAMAARALGGVEGDKAQQALEKMLETEETNIALVEAIEAVAQHRAGR